MFWILNIIGIGHKLGCLLRCSIRATLCTHAYCFLEWRKYKEKNPMSACLSSYQVVDFSDISSFTTHQITQHMSHFPS